MLRGRRASRSAAAGNIGRPLLDAAGDDVDVVVAEVSSFQLAFTTAAFAPDVAVLLNVAEDHLDWHGSAEAYAAAKARVFAHQGAGRRARRERRRPGRRRARGRRARAGRPRSCAGAPDRADYGVRDGMLVGPAGVARAGAGVAARRTTSPTRSPPPPPRSRSGADAAAVGRDARRLRTGSPHRVQLGRRASTACAYVDDSKATNPHATASALDGLRARRADRGRPQQGARPRRPPAATRRGCAPSSRSARPPARSRRRSPALVPVARADSMHDAVARRGRSARSRGDVGAAVARVRVVRLVRELRRARRRLRPRGASCFAEGEPAAVPERRTAMTAFTSASRAHRHAAAAAAARPRAADDRAVVDRDPARRRRSRCSTSSAW